MEAASSPAWRLSAPLAVDADAELVGHTGGAHMPLDLVVLRAAATAMEISRLAVAAMCRSPWGGDAAPRFRSSTDFRSPSPGFVFSGQPLAAPPVLGQDLVGIACGRCWALGV
uniref:Uncharacterized protein n=1 Tax=Oryza rufipogon TaxID=4529 RepID=A0A0E0MR95_ORYRU